MSLWPCVSMVPPLRPGVGGRDYCSAPPPSAFFYFPPRPPRPVRAGSAALHRPRASGLGAWRKKDRGGGGNTKDHRVPTFRQEEERPPYAGCSGGEGAVAQKEALLPAENHRDAAPSGPGSGSFAGCRTSFLCSDHCDPAPAGPCGLGRRLHSTDQESRGPETASVKGQAGQPVSSASQRVKILNRVHAPGRVPGIEQNPQSNGTTHN